MRCTGWIALGLGLAACSRTPLTDPFAGGSAGGAGGGGGASTSSSSSSSSASSSSSSSSGAGGDGTGGAGGLPVGSCAAVGPIAELAGVADELATFAPRLTRATADGESILLATGWQLAEGPGEIPPPELRHTTWKPWVAWPADGALEPTYLADFDGGGSFDVARDADGVAALFQNALAPPANAPAVVFMPGIDPGSGNVPEAYSVLGTIAQIGVLAQGQGTHLAGFTTSGPQGDLVRAAPLHVGPNGLLPLSVFTLGCSTGLGHVAATATGDHFVVAYSDGMDEVGCPFGNVGPPERLRIALVGPDPALEFGPTLEVGPGPLVDVRAAPSPDGAWIVWSRAAAAGASVSFARVDASGASILAPTSLTQGVDPTILGAADLGARLVVAHAPALSSSDARLDVVVLDASGATAATGTLPLGAPALGAPALAGSPTGDSFVLAWTDQAGGVARVKVVRFDCNLP